MRIKLTVESVDKDTFILFTINLDYIFDYFFKIY